MNRADFLAALTVNAGNTTADAANKFVIKAVCCCGNLLYSDDFISIPTHQGYGVIQSNSRDVSNIYHQLIHTDSA